MDVQRIGREVQRAQQQFAYVEVHGTDDGGVFVKAALQTSLSHLYIVAIYFDDYPYQMPRVFVLRPAIVDWAPHRYRDGNLCFLHPSMWNPGLHDLVFVLKRTAKWLNKYDVFTQTRNWPGAQLDH